MNYYSIDIVKNKITLKELQKIAKQGFGDLVKAVVDIDREMIAMDAELHADLEALLLEERHAQAAHPLQQSF